MYIYIYMYKRVCLCARARVYIYNYDIHLCDYLSVFVCLGMCLSLIQLESMHIII